MKNILIASLALLIGNTVVAQKISAKDVPAEVASTFKNKYSTAEKATWEMEYDNYQVEFTFLKTQMTALFDATGKWLETDYYMNSSELPKEIKDSLSKQFGTILNTYSIDEAQKVESPNRDLFYYLVVIQNLSTYDMILKENGHIVVMEKRTEDSEGIIKFKKTKGKK